MSKKDEYALAIINEGKRRGITPRGRVIAVATALVETNLIMYANERDPESLNYPHEALSWDYKSSGLFQQQPPWWGTAADRMDPTRSAGMFYEQLARLDYNSDAHSPGWYAQQVQQSAYPDRYDERMSEAQAIYDRLTGSGSKDTVGEYVLPYDRGIVPQETYYWCGPASTQVVLNSRGVNVDESTLAREIGTHTGGTDYVGLITPILNKYLGGGYEPVYIQNDPASRSQKEKLWRDIVASINGGFGVVANIVAPVSNYPRGVKGSVSPSYSGGTVYHYVAIMGYDDTPDSRAVWVADSGFAPYGYWCSFDQMATLIPPKGYAANTSAADARTDKGEELSWGEVIENLDGQKVSREDMIKWIDRRLIQVERMVTAVLEQIGGAGVAASVARGEPAAFDGFPQGGNRSLYDLAAATAAKSGVAGAVDLKKAGK
ncbi:C39 family peptidase [Nocardia cyriacigeorgica]|uniref:C39 family peptidase n=1 Tax=Nocardia cyriacigeorgica TaxID=135487 RepID=UPI002454E974|nr:C39 family peptidase [Nocardia cyriacigeorgica]